MKKIDLFFFDLKVFGWQKMCFWNFFVVGMVDMCDFLKCQFVMYIFLVLFIMMVSVIGFKFIVFINFGFVCVFEDYDKFVICQVFCYIEG